MAEFASAVVGLIAVGARVGESIYDLITTLKDAPHEFLALSNEVTEFRVILMRLTETPDAKIGGPRAGLNIVLRNSKTILEEVERQIQLVRKVGVATGDIDITTPVDRIRWLRKVKKAQKLQLSLRMQKITVSNYLAVQILLRDEKTGKPSEWTANI
ncbi:unnamed protein product [Clonostachys rosea]|uniref:Fungal N-terminal domain-containing protein n=1 Tax=Bionectria ochroleuca TaxID=29856 RepID=A0ABY6UL92_BIOOC|nr:unnamed protein product [Clonostachys rosea]